MYCKIKQTMVPVRRYSLVAKYTGHAGEVQWARTSTATQDHDLCYTREL